MATGNNWISQQLLGCVSVFNKLKERFTLATENDLKLAISYRGRLQKRWIYSDRTT